MSAHRCIRCKSENKPDYWSWYAWLPQPGEPPDSHYWVLCVSCENELVQKAFAMEQGVGSCAVREHAGLEKLIQKVGVCQPLLPDPELGQDVALVAHMLTTAKEMIDSRTGALQAIHQFSPHELGSLTGQMCKVTCPVCVAKKALGYDKPAIGQGMPGTSPAGGS